jgi:non-specific serine/threonine protein kinase
LEGTAAISLERLAGLPPAGQTDPIDAAAPPAPRSADDRPPPDAAARTALTAREREVAALVAQGLTNRQIARALHVTAGTAANHVEHIREKLGARTKAEIAARVAAGQPARPVGSPAGP